MGGYLGAMAPSLPLRPGPRLGCLALLVVTLGGCSGGGLGVDPLSDIANIGAKNPLIPNQVAGGDPDDPALRRGTDREAGTDPVTAAEAEALRRERMQQAATLWANAERTQDPEDAADLYAEIAEEYPEYARAAEARYRAGVQAYRRRAWYESFDQLRSYMQVAPVNPHLKDIERMIFEGGRRLLAENREGTFSMFKSDEGATTMLSYVAQAFPAGLYADDALYVLGRHYQGEREPDTAALTYRQLIISYPDSEWVYMTRLALGDTYLERDQGEPYHAGFVDRDPRERLPSAEAAPFAGPVKSGPELALEQFEAFLDAVRMDPRRRVEYAQHVTYAEGRARQIRQALAAKERRTAAFYRSNGDGNAARVYEEAAQRWLAGRTDAPTVVVPGGPMAEPPPLPGSGAGWPTAPVDTTAPSSVPYEPAPADMGPIPPTGMPDPDIDPTTGLPWGVAPHGTPAPTTAPYVVPYEVPAPAPPGR